MKSTSSTPSHVHSRVIANSPVYYGWVILFAGTLGMIMTTPGQTLGVSVFLDSMINDLGLSRETVSFMYTIGTLTASFALPFVGRFIDRRGPRLAVVIIASLLALACVWMGFVQGLVTLVIGFVLIRGLGQGSLSLVSLYIVNVWFVKRRGLAVGISGLGFSMATAFFPLIIESLLQTFGWRQAYMLLGLLVAVTILPIGAWLFRGTPEQFGLQPDSGKVKEDDKPLNEVNYTPAEARRTLTFWLFLAGNFCVAALSTGLVFHHYSIMAEGGLDRVAAATVFISFGFIAAGANFLTGVLMDRVPPRFLLTSVMSALACALVLATFVTSSSTIIIYGILLGIVQGMNGAISASVYAYYFGRAHIGSIKGFVSTIGVAGTAFGPFLFAVGQGQAGSYTPVLIASASLPLLIGISALFIKPNHKNPQVTASS